MLKAVTFTNFKIVRSLKVPLSPFTVLVGPNGVGKSTVLEGLYYLHLLGTPIPQEHTKDYDRYRLLFAEGMAPTYIASRPNSASFGIELSGDKGEHFGFLAGLDGKRDFQGISTWLKEGESEKTLVLPGDPNPRNFFSDPYFSNLSSVIRLALDPRALRQPSLAAAENPALAQDGKGLPSLLDHMASLRDGSLEQVEADLSKLVPTFRRIHFEKQELTWRETEVLLVDSQAIDRRVPRSGPGRAIELEFKGAGRIPANHVSEGTILSLAILTVVHGPVRPRLLLLDDVDRALHPSAQVELVKALKSVVAASHDLQIVTTAHSPMVIAGCDSADVIRLAFDAPGNPVVASAKGDPTWMTPSEIMERYFGVDRLGASEMLQRYAVLAADAHRSEEEDREVKGLRKKLRRMGADPGWAPAKRVQP